MAALESFFGLKERKSTIGIEVMAGVTTFMVSAYIIFVNPSILSLGGDGVPFAPALAATCLITAVLTLAYGLWAKYPFLIAPGMGLNAVVAYQLIVGAGLAWQEAMAVIFLEGLFILILVLTGFRQAMMSAIPIFLKKAISVGIGLFILTIGLVNGGLIMGTGIPADPLALGDYSTYTVLVTIIGIAITVFLLLRNIKGALLWGILITTAVAIIINLIVPGALPVGATVPTAIIALPDFSTLGAPFQTVDGNMALVSMFAKLGFLAAILTIFSLMLSDFFDTMGTIVGIGSEAGFLDNNGEYPKSDLTKILVVDSLGAMLGGAAGTSSATTYIESAAGVSEGGRTGLTSVVTALLFLVMMFFSPIAAVIPPQATAPALIIVGLFMCAVIADIKWKEAEEGLPALMTVVMMPLTYSITNGIGWGFIMYGLVKLFKGEAGKIHWLMWVIIAAFVVYFGLPWFRDVFNF